MVIGIAGQEAHLLGLVAQPEAERVAIAGEGGVRIAVVEIDMRDLARAVGMIGMIGMIVDAADHRDVAPFRVLKAEAVIAVRLAQVARAHRWS